MLLGSMKGYALACKYSTPLSNAETLGYNCVPLVQKVTISACLVKELHIFDHFAFTVVRIHLR